MHNEDTGRIEVSIHVPAKGTTDSVSSSCRIRDVSIHVPAKGTTPAGFTKEHINELFQSTFPRRERHRGGGMPTATDRGFNPRSREGNDEGSALK